MVTALRSLALAALATLAAACTPASLVNVFVPTGALEVSRNIAYGPEPRQQLDVYRPRNARGPRPMVVFLYGGNWDSGERQSYLFVAEALVSRGYVVVVPDYRVYPQVVFPGFVEDAASAVAWAVRHGKEFDGDPARLFVMGHSAGAHLAALLALDSHFLAAQGLQASAIAGLIGLAGPYDFLPLTSEKLRRVFPEEVREASQPIRFVGPASPRALLATGEDDTTVRPGNTERLARRLRDAGVAVTELSYPNLSHVGIVAALAAPLRSRTMLLDEIERFIGANEKGAASTPRPAS